MNDHRSREGALYHLPFEHTPHGKWKARLSPRPSQRWL